MQITSKEDLIRELAEMLDFSDIESCPYVDLTNQEVSVHLDYSVDPSLKEYIEGHKIVNIESKRSDDEYEIMLAFARSRNDRERKKIIQAISGRRPFRAFDNCVDMLGISDDWYKFKDEAFKQFVEDILEEYEIDFVDGKIVCSNPNRIETVF